MVIIISTHHRLSSMLSVMHTCTYVCLPTKSGHISLITVTMYSECVYIQCTCTHVLTPALARSIHVLIVCLLYDCTCTNVCMAMIGEKFVWHLQRVRSCALSSALEGVYQHHFDISTILSCTYTYRTISDLYSLEESDETTAQFRHHQTGKTFFCLHYSPRCSQPTELPL